MQNFSVRNITASDCLYQHHSWLFFGKWVAMVSKALHLLLESASNLQKVCLLNLYVINCIICSFIWFFSFHWRSYFDYTISYVDYWLCNVKFIWYATINLYQVSFGVHESVLLFKKCNLQTVILLQIHHHIINFYHQLIIVNQIAKLWNNGTS